MTKQDNITAELKDNKLVITIDVSKQIVDGAPLSASRKNRVLASTRGFMSVNNGPAHLPEVRIGLNVITR